MGRQWSKAPRPRLQGVGSGRQALLCNMGRTGSYTIFVSGFKFSLLHWPCVVSKILLSHIAWS